MRSSVANFLIFLILMGAGTGCSVTTIKPDIKACTSDKKLMVRTFTYKYEHGGNGFGLNEEFKEGILDRTRLILTGSTKVSSRPTPGSGYDGKSYHLDIGIKQNPFGGAGGFDYLTGLSLGIIPSWHTWENLYEYSFHLYENGNLITKEDYSINVTSIGHLLLLPVGLIQSMKKDNYGLYKRALRSIINACETDEISMATAQHAGLAGVKTDKAIYSYSETIDVTFSGAPGLNSDWLCIVPAGSSDTETGNYKYLPKGLDAGIRTFDPLAPGKYEVRAYYNYRKVGHVVAARTAFTVTGDEAYAKTMEEHKRK